MVSAASARSLPSAEVSPVSAMSCMGSPRSSSSRKKRCQTEQDAKARGNAGCRRQHIPRRRRRVAVGYEGCEAARKGPREAEAAKERPFFTESNKGLGIAAPRPPPTRCAEAKRREAAQTEGRAHERSEVTARGRAKPASPRRGNVPI